MYILYDISDRAETIYLYIYIYWSIFDIIVHIRVCICVYVCVYVYRCFQVLLRLLGGP